MSRIGIYAGTFDPVHAGHIAFALQAMQIAKLDHVYFLPERRPRHKTGVEHFGHRVAMLTRASKPHPKFGVLEYVDVSFSVERTLPKLQKQFTGSQLVLLVGSDLVPGMVHWPHFAQLFKACELVIGVRSEDDMEQVQKTVEEWLSLPLDVTVLQSYAPHVSSATIREALRTRQSAAGILQSVARYSDHHWLYVSVA